MFQIVNVQIGLRLSQLRFRSVLVIPLLFATTAFAQRITTINNKGTKHISGNIVTEAATAPTTPTPIEGDIWINSTTNTTKFWGGDSWEPIAAARAFALIDNDGDTRITVEENADEDVIRFYLGDDPGVTAAEYFRMRGPRLEVVNSGNSVFVGEGAGANDDLSINQNVFIGYQTGRANITGNQNVATGYQTLNSNTTGAGNTSMGYNSLSSNVAGNNGVAIGRESQHFANNQTAAWNNSNTSVGYRSLRGSAIPANNTGVGNTALGYLSLFNNTTGGQNVATGYQTLFNNTTGNNNVAVGNSALSNNVAGSGGVAIGRESQRNANDQTAGWTNTNTSVGYQSLRGSATPADNTGLANTALGYQSLFNNTSGNDNTATGRHTLFNNTTGNNNVAIGNWTLLNNTTGYNNTAIGYGALHQNVAGINGVAIGLDSQRNANNQTTTWTNTNTSLGYQSLRGSATPAANTGVGNTALGYQALLNNSSGVSNTAIGNAAGSVATNGAANATGNQGIFIGDDTRPSADGNINEIVIGTGARGAGSNSIRLGNTAITSAHVQVGWTVSSDKRWKENITTLPYGLDFITKLRPVAYTRKNSDTKTKELGFIAQELEAALQEIGFDDQGLLSKDAEGYYNVRYNDFMALAIKGIQEQQQQIKRQGEQLKSQQQLLNLLMARMEVLEKK